MVELLEWWGEDQDAERVATAIQHVFARISGISALVTVSEVEAIVNLDATTDGARPNAS